MSYTRLISQRYLQSRRNAGFFSFITAIATAGVMLGTAALIIALSVLGGFEREITEKVVGFTSHVQILGFQSQPLPDFDENADRIEDAFPVVQSVSPFVAREALVKSSSTVDGILLKGVDPTRDNGMIRRYVVEGEYDIERPTGGMPRIVMGRRLAQKLSVGIDDRVTLFGVGGLASARQPRVMQFRVTGLYESGMAEYDDVYAFTDLAEAQQLFEFGRGVSGYDLRLASVDSADAVAAAVPDLLGYPHFGRTVFDSYRNLFSWIELQKKPIPIILGLIIVVATVNIVGTLLMMVLDKTREIGVLASLGATRGGITSIFLRQGLTIALSGTALGNIFAFVLLFVQSEFRVLSLPSDIYFMTSVPVLLRVEDFLLVSVVSIVLCLVSALVPARLAARLNPVTAIRLG
ncbi:MAG: Lipoprotein-releasing system permease protein [Bacteroidetes bacterium]|nr:Lipoprotein-releasing system permease protein [Bacteroidota bacterium]